MQKDSGYWDNIVTEYSKKQSFLWREYSNVVNTFLIENWISKHCRKVLKTDLFDEAINQGLLPQLKLHGDEVYGVDISEKAVDMAKKNYPSLHTCFGDVRNLPFGDKSFDLIFSNSTIDHFNNHNCVEQSLKEFYRILNDDGEMIITIDNLANPLIYIRNTLMKLKIEIAPYYVGRTYTPKRFSMLLEKNGFIIEKMSTCMHFPRVLLVFIEKYMNKIIEPQCLLKFCQRFEHLSQTYFGVFTGYFVAVRVRKNMQRK